jgi:Carboxypeptidase regulatory-like domain
MRYSLLSTILIVGGLGLLLAGLGRWAAPIAVHAQDQPPPRPTLTPQPPTATARPSDDEPDSTPVPASRITGTVIDQTSGAPAPGIQVQVGDGTITTDGNGNYDRAGLPPGSYTVALVLAAGQGEPAQGPLTVDLPAAATVVQHLAFRSPLPVAQPRAAPTSTPAMTPPRLPRTAGSSDGWLAFALGMGMLAAGAALRWRR